MYEVIRKLLEVKLNALGTFPTKYENAPYKPVIGTAYQAVHLLPADTVNPFLGDTGAAARQRETGVFQVTLFYPENAGPAAAATRAKAIREHFYRGLTLSESQVLVRILQTPSIAKGFPDGTFYAVPVSIYYVADVN